MARRRVLLDWRSLRHRHSYLAPEPASPLRLVMTMELEGGILMA
jgi:hypothetical protein